MRRAVLGLSLTLATGALAQGTLIHASVMGVVVDADTQAPAPEAQVVARGVEGSMQVRWVVTVEGAVRECKVVKGLPFMNRAVIEALEKRKYRPALAQGKAVDVFYMFNIKLKLPSR